MATFWTTLTGFVIIAWTLRETFRDLFQPSGAGALSSFMGRKFFEIARRVKPLMSVVGPLTVVLVIASWAILITLGFALIFWGRYPEAFLHAELEPHDPVGRFWAAVYFSLASLTTLASGNLSPRTGWLRILAAFESLVGISLTTASVTWIVLIYPALGRMRSLARFASVLVRAERETGVDIFSGPGDSLLITFAERVIRSRVDFIHFPLIYYFHADTERAALARSLESLQELSDRASSDQIREQDRLPGAMLRAALSDLAEVLAKKFLPGSHGKHPAAVFRAVARDHQEEDGKENE